MNDESTPNPRREPLETYFVKGQRGGNEIVLVTLTTDRRGCVTTGIWDKGYEIRAMGYGERQGYGI